MLVGIDIVDLREPRVSGKAGDERFLRRVLDDLERRAIRRSPDPEQCLWSLWASKEAAFKVVSKLRGAPPAFHHSAFGVRLDPPQDQGGGAALGSGHVLYEGLCIPVSALAHHERVVQALAYRSEGAEPDADRLSVGVELLDAPDRPWSAPTGELLTRFSAREADAIHGRASAAVRLGARGAAAEALGVAEDRLEIVCAPGPTGQRPPSLLVDGEPTDADVSLSHHGEWIAWAVSAPRARGASRPPRRQPGR